MDEEAQKVVEEETKRKQNEEDEKEKQRLENAEKREHPHMQLWLKTKLEILYILFY